MDSGTRGVQPAIKVVLSAKQGSVPVQEALVARYLKRHANCSSPHQKMNRVVLLIANLLEILWWVILSAVVSMADCGISGR